MKLRAAAAGEVLAKLELTAGRGDGQKQGSNSWPSWPRAWQLESVTTHPKSKEKRKEERKVSGGGRGWGKEEGKAR